MLDNVTSLLHDYAISWFGQAVCKLPFIKESRLLAEVTKVEHTLTVMLNFVNEFSDLKLQVILFILVFGVSNP